MLKRLAVAVFLLALLGVAACGDDEPAQPSVPPVVVVSDLDTIRGTHKVPTWAKVAPEQIAEAKEHGVPVAFENDLGMRFVLIPSAGLPPMLYDGKGAPIFGSPFDTKLHPSEGEAGAGGRPYIKHAYYVQTTEVTNAHYRRMRPDHDSGGFKGHSLNGDSQPVVSVSWADAHAFAAWLSGRGRRRYVLPTVLQWRNASEDDLGPGSWQMGPFWGAHKFANALDGKSKEMLRVSGKIMTRDDGHRVSAPVGSYLPNRWGLHDVAGNVSEMTRRLWHDYPPHIEAGPGPIQQVGDRRLPPPLQHGSFMDEGLCHGGSYRSALDAFEWGTASVFHEPLPESDRGFRLVSPLPEPKSGE